MTPPPIPSQETEEDEEINSLTGEPYRKENLDERIAKYVFIYISFSFNLWQCI